MTRDKAREARQVQHNFKQSLQVDRRQQVQEAVTPIRSLMEYGRIREAWDRISRWYQQVKSLQPPLSTEALDQVSMERAEFYRCRLPEGLRVAVLV